MSNIKKQKLKKYHTVYETKNLINGKIYVGAHSTDNIYDDYIGSGDNIQSAVKKYGIENFKKTILHVFDTPEEMFSAEASIVTEEFIKREDVYNIVVGGFGGRNKGSKDLVHMHKKETNERCAVHKIAVEKMISEGWNIGRNMSSTTNTVWIHKDNLKKMILPENLNEHLDSGWNLGLPKSFTKSKKWIYNPAIDKYSLCSEDDLENMLKEGWVKKKWAVTTTRSGKKIKSDHKTKLHTFCSPTGLEETCTRKEFQEKYNMSSSDMTIIINGHRKLHKGWSLKQ